MLIDPRVHPHIPTGWSVVVHSITAPRVWNFDSTRLYRSRAQSEGQRVLGHALCAEIRGMSAYNANMLDALLASPHEIPSVCEGSFVLFMGTVYAYDGRLYVRALFRLFNVWRWRPECLDYEFGILQPVALSSKKDDE